MNRFLKTHAGKVAQASISAAIGRFVVGRVQPIINMADIGPILDWLAWSAVCFFLMAGILKLWESLPRNKFKSLTGEVRSCRDYINR